MTSTATILSAATLKAERQLILRRLEIIEQLIELDTTFNHQVDPTKYRDRSIASSLEEELTLRGGRAKRGECLRALLDQGCDMGSRPDSSLEITISRNRAKFSREGEFVLLRVDEEERKPMARVA